MVTFPQPEEQPAAQIDSSARPEPAVGARVGAQVCANPRCSTLLDNDAEICDECGTSSFVRLGTSDCVLCGWAGERPVVFRVRADRPQVVGRAHGSMVAPDVDLSRFPDSEHVHRRHAQIEKLDSEWRITQLGTNPLRVSARRVEPGTSTRVQSGDVLDVASVRLLFLTPPPAA
jgi:FHA domain